MKESYQKKPAGARPLRNADTLASIKRAEYEEQQKRHAEEGMIGTRWPQGPQAIQSSLIDGLSVVELLNYIDRSLTSLHETISELEIHFDPVLRPSDMAVNGGVPAPSGSHSNLIYRCIEVNERIGHSRERLYDITKRSEIQ